MYESAASGAAATTPTAGGYTVGPVATITAKGARNVALRDSAVAAVAAAATGSGGAATTSVVGIAAAALAALTCEPILAKSTAAAASSCGVAITNDTSHLPIPHIAVARSPYRWTARCLAPRPAATSRFRPALGRSRCPRCSRQLPCRCRGEARSSGQHQATTCTNASAHVRRFLQFLQRGLV